MDCCLYLGLTTLERMMMWCMVVVDALSDEVGEISSLNLLVEPFSSAINAFDLPLSFC